MKLEHTLNKKFKIFPGTIKTYIVDKNDYNLKHFIICGSKIKQLFVNTFLGTVLKKFTIFILKNVEFGLVYKLEELRKVDNFLEKKFPDFSVVAVTPKPNWEKECIYIVICFNKEYYFVKIINNSSVLMEEFSTELENLKNLDNTESIHFPKLVLEFETTNLKISVTKFVFGKYAKLSNKNIMDLGLALRNLKMEKYIVNDKYFSHCDLAPWNYKLCNSKIVILDLGSTNYKHENYDKYFYYVLDFNFKKSFIKSLEQIPKNLHDELFLDINKRLSGDDKLKEKAIQRLKLIKSI
tara:strand:+ start:75 stop:959 length:885 start_codon:yes stop_codon:yes gene_type:complete